MSKERPKIGDRIIVFGRNSNSNLWDSGAGGKCPNRLPQGQLEYPFTDIIEDMNDESAIKIRGYGFSLNNLIWEFANKEVNYDIY